MEEFVSLVAVTIICITFLVIAHELLRRTTIYEVVRDEENRVVQLIVRNVV